MGKLGHSHNWVLTRTEKVGKYTYKFYTCTMPGCPSGGFKMEIT